MFGSICQNDITNIVQNMIFFVFYRSCDLQVWIQIINLHLHSHFRLQVDTSILQVRQQLLGGTAYTPSRKTHQLKQTRGLFTSKTNRIRKCLQRIIFIRLTKEKKVNIHTNAQIVENLSIGHLALKYTCEFTVENDRTNARFVENLSISRAPLDHTWEYTLVSARTNAQVVENPSFSHPALKNTS